LSGVFLDSCVVAKWYHTEVGTEGLGAVLVLTRLAGQAAYISRLAAIEVQSVVAKKVRQGVISQADAQLLRARFLLDLRTRSSWRVVALRARHYQKAERLIRTYGDTYALKTLDALQLAVALDLKERGLPETFVSADGALCNVARIAGLQVKNPEGI
jgi:predicted nucleic acid-binding protein